jgi:hypothetical protein
MGRMTVLTIGTETIIPARYEMMTIAGPIRLDTIRPMPTTNVETGMITSALEIVIGTTTYVVATATGTTTYAVATRTETIMLAVEIATGTEDRIIERFKRAFRMA